MENKNSNEVILFAIRDKITGNYWWNFDSPETGWTEDIRTTMNIDEAIDMIFEFESTNLSVDPEIVQISGLIS